MNDGLTESLLHRWNNVPPIPLKYFVYQVYSTMTSYSKIKGFADLFPADSNRYRRMEEAARSVFGRYGYGELRTPILERTELFARSIGEETDVVSKEMYTFPDRKGRSLTMRPEATAGVMRAFIENKMATQDTLERFFTIGPMFRYERPQKGRMRQFHQINAECLGPQEATADADVMLMLMAFFRELGIEGLRLEVNSLGCRECRPAYHETLRSYLSGLARESLCEDCQRRLETNPLRVLDCKVPGCKELVAKAPRLIDYNCEPCKSHFQQVLALLDACGQTYELNHLLVRGLDYYVRTTFEVVSGDIGAQSSVAGGGRYDGLIKQLGGPDIPGIGFACGMERLALLLPEEETLGPVCYLAVLAERGMTTALRLAQELRGAGFACELSFGARSMKSQMRQANKRSARYIVLLGDNELDNNTVEIKHLESGEQVTVDQGGLADFFASRVSA